MKNSSDDEPISDLREAVSVNIADGTLDPDDFTFEFDEDDARQTISEDPLSVQVRSGWYSLGDSDADKEPAEFEILLCTGGPAVRIVGDLEQWTAGTPAYSASGLGYALDRILPHERATSNAKQMQTYCEQFYFGD